LLRELDKGAVIRGIARDENNLEAGNMTQGEHVDRGLKDVLYTDG
jgi:hypothetical protein